MIRKPMVRIEVGEPKLLALAAALIVALGDLREPLKVNVDFELRNSPYVPPHVPPTPVSKQPEPPSTALLITGFGAPFPEAENGAAKPKLPNWPVQVELKSTRADEAPKEGTVPETLGLDMGSPMDKQAKMGSEAGELLPAAAAALLIDFGAKTELLKLELEALV